MIINMHGAAGGQAPKEADWVTIRTAGRRCLPLKGKKTLLHCSLSAGAAHCGELRNQGYYGIVFDMERGDVTQELNILKKNKLISVARQPWGFAASPADYTIMYTSWRAFNPRDCENPEKTLLEIPLYARDIVLPYACEGIRPIYVQDALCIARYMGTPIFNKRPEMSAYFCYYDTAQHLVIMETAHSLTKKIADVRSAGFFGASLINLF